MSEITVRQITGEEFLQVLYPKMNYAFRASPPMSDEKEWRERISAFKDVTSFAVFEGNEAQAVASSTAMTQNIRGNYYPMGGIWGVATDPSARRKGYAKQAMIRLLTEIHELGHAVSGLYPFRESFYQRLGYATFPQVRIAKFDPADLGSVLNMDLPGHVERVIGSEGFVEYRQFLEKYQKDIHGMALVDKPPEFSPYRDKVWIAFAKIESKTVGSMLYSLEGSEVNFTMKIHRFHYTVPEGRYLLLDWIARHVDQAVSAEITLPPFEFPETWFADMNIKYQSTFPTPMGRVIDVSKLDGMETGPGSFTANITDPICPWNDGAWKFESVNGTLMVSPASQVDCTLSIQGLSALIYGTHDPKDFSLRGWGDPAPDIQDTMRSMFDRQLPFMYEQY
jgi:predicted acetyltransferase